MSVALVNDDSGKPVYRAEAVWDNWSLFKITADYQSAEAALNAVPEFAVALTELLGERGVSKGLVSRPDG
jgi:hypothetical protein